MNKNIIIGVLIVAVGFLWYKAYAVKPQPQTFKQAFDSQFPPTTPQPTLSSDELFAKNQQCATYKTNVQQKLDKTYVNNNMGLWETFGGIFYSPTRNSCVYYWTIMGQQDKNGKFVNTYEVDDAVTDEHILETGDNTMWNQEITTLKGSQQQ